MKKLTRAERLEKFEDDIDAWREGKLELVTRKFVVQAPPDYSGQDIKRIREDLNMSQAEFARLIGVSTRTVESWEHGHRTPDGAASRTIEMYSSPPWRDQVRLPNPPAAGRPKRSTVEASAPIPAVEGRGRPRHLERFNPQLCSHDGHTPPLDGPRA